MYPAVKVVKNYLFQVYISMHRKKKTRKKYKQKPIKVMPVQSWVTFTLSIF